MKDPSQDDTWKRVRPEIKKGEKLTGKDAVNLFGVGGSATIIFLWVLHLVEDGMQAHVWGAFEIPEHVETALIGIFCYYLARRLRY